MAEFHELIDRMEDMPGMTLGMTLDAITAYVEATEEEPDNAPLTLDALLADLKLWVETIAWGHADSAPTAERTVPDTDDPAAVRAYLVKRASYGNEPAHQRYADVAVVIDSGLVETDNVSTQEEVDAMVNYYRETEATADVQVFVIWHEHGLDLEGEECACAQYATDHRPYAQWGGPFPMMETPRFKLSD
jgi:hypothetical protein